jgi:hypothetical protein
LQLRLGSEAANAAPDVERTDRNRPATPGKEFVQDLQKGGAARLEFTRRPHPR